MLEKETWKEGDGVYGLPKIKTIRIKIKKEKAAEKPEAEGITAAEATVATTASTEGQGTTVKAPAKAQKEK
jgi:hypothetical protein